MSPVKKSECQHVYDDDLLVDQQSRPGDLCRLCLEPKPGRVLSHDESGCSPDCGCPRCPNGYPSPHEHVGDACVFPEIAPARTP